MLIGMLGTWDVAGLDEEGQVVAFFSLLGLAVSSLALQAGGIDLVAWGNLLLF